MDIPFGVNLLKALLLVPPFDHGDCEKEEGGLDDNKAKDSGKQVVQVKVSRVGDLSCASKNLGFVVIAGNFAAEAGCRLK